MIENRPRALEFDRARRDDEEGQRQDEQTHADHHIERPLQELIERTAAEPVGEEEPAWSERLEIDGPSFPLPKVEKVNYFDAGELAMKKMPHRQATTVISRDNDLAGPQPIDKFRQSIGLGSCPVHRIGTAGRVLPGGPD